MFIPPQFRLFAIGLYFFVTWKFLTLGAILLGASLLAMFDLRPESPALMAMGAFFGLVGGLAFFRLKNAMEQSTL